MMLNLRLQQSIGSSNRFSAIDNPTVVDDENALDAVIRLLKQLNEQLQSQTHKYSNQYPMINRPRNYFDFSSRQKEKSLLTLINTVFMKTW